MMFLGSVVVALEDMVFFNCHGICQIPYEFLSAPTLLIW
jgi:hypothetical protein